MKNIILKIKGLFLAHKISGTVIILVVIFGGNLFFQKVTSTKGENRYILSTATTGTIISSITGTGQVAALNQINIQPQVSGVITYVGVNPGDRVSVGRTLFSIDNTSALKAVRDAEINLQSAQNSLEKLKIQDSSDNLNTNLAQAYDDGFSTVSNTFLDLPGIMTGLDNMFFEPIPSTGQENISWYAGQVPNKDQAQALVFKQNFSNAYNQALAAYNANFQDYKNTSRTSDNATIQKIISETYSTTALISDAVKDANNYIDFVNNSMQLNNFNIPAIVASNKTTLSGFTSKTNSDLTSLITAKTNIKNNTDTFSNSDLDLQSSELAVTQRENSLQDAKDNLALYSIHAPFNGIIASVPVQRGQNVGSGTTLATIITSDQTATISLNEVDVSKIQLDDKVTVTFDAIPDLTITGKVAEIDSIGTVSQGVVNYNVKISFDTNDARIKPGMSINAAIITNVKQNILTVPNSAIKSAAGANYVLMFDSPLATPVAGTQGSTSPVPPRQQIVTIGVTDGTSTEIVSGLKEGNEVVTRTITPSATSTTTTPSLFGSSTNRAGGAAVRVPTTTGR